MLKIPCVFRTIILVIVAVGVFLCGSSAFGAADDYPWKVDRTVFFPHDKYSTFYGFNILYEGIINKYAGEYGVKLQKGENYYNLYFEIVLVTKGNPDAEPYCENGETVIVYRGFWAPNALDVICHITLYMDTTCEGYKKDEEAFYKHLGLDSRNP